VNVADSSAWIEYVIDGPNAPAFAPIIEDAPGLIVPTLTLFEVYRRITQIVDQEAAMAAAGLMLQGSVVELSATLALSAAQLSSEAGLAMADSIILATARAHSAVLWTQDAHFEGMLGVDFRARL
jgi:predicted nucleic acid-binding protein